MQNPETALKFALACTSLQQNSSLQVLHAVAASLPELFPGSRFQLDEQTLLPVGWFSEVEHRGYVSLPPTPLAYTVTLASPPSEAEKLLLACFLQQFEQALLLTAFQEELDRQARRDWLTGLPHRFQLYRQLDAYGRLLSSYHVGLLELTHISSTDQLHRPFMDHLILEVVKILKQHTLHAYRFESERFVFILDQQQKENLLTQLADMPELGVRLSWADTWEGSPENIVEALVSRMQTA
ncbi:GGDEF domain-containing protein [Deinococcus roseus]|uniref:GGDEF domain-containing protein n=1 Tax=Deinococcus roseus TaxID=392414 RepID=A0ABQ2CYE5_9DEIO|nr:GGDEF domain-containing protein [Deinococcus roseus]GGJ29442.1 hypothetical protein GCM10008938_14450 [Deinococcus roseus]